MASHGVARSARTRTEEQRKQDLVKIERYRFLEDELRSKVSENNYGLDTFQLTSKLLKLNPEYYTVWNVRRRCLISGLLSRPSASSSQSKESSNGSPTSTKRTSYDDASSSSSAAATRPDPDRQTTGQSGTTADGGGDAEKDLEVLQGELYWIIPLLMEFPKCYWIWNYRLWLLDQAIKRLSRPVARKIWEEELALDGKMLNKDTRNFHAWGYRRHLIKTLEGDSLKGESLVEPEFEYTTRMIGRDLSNFSAWHNRSKLIPRLLNERKADDKERQEFLDHELSQIKEGLNVGPEDESLWSYHQYLILNLVDDAGPATIAPNLTPGERAQYLRREIDDVKDLLEDYMDVKAIYEALLEYVLLLCTLEKRKPSHGEQQDMQAWLRKLQIQDSMRNGRWKDIEDNFFASHRSK